MRFIPDFRALLFLIETLVLVCILDLLPFVAVLVDHKEAVVAGVVVVRVVDATQGEATALETGNIRSVRIVGTTIIP
jgi:hypothetical protein